MLAPTRLSHALQKLKVKLYYLWDLPIVPKVPPDGFQELKEGTNVFLADKGHKLKAEVIEDFEDVCFLIESTTRDIDEHLYANDPILVQV